MNVILTWTKFLHYRSVFALNPYFLFKFYKNIPQLAFIIFIYFKKQSFILIENYHTT